jgi:3-dehydrosphinganine reductase
MVQVLRLIVGGILALPAITISVLASIIAWVLFLPSMALLAFQKPNCRSSRSRQLDRDEVQEQKYLRGHAIITGGSSGIGLAIAKECVMKGMDLVTILARHEGKLNQCLQELEAIESTSKRKRKTKVQAISVNVTDSAAMASVASQVLSSTPDDDLKEATPVYLFCCAGTAKSGRFGELSPTDFAEQMQTNYLGSVYAVHAFLPRMARGTIVLTSSVAGQIGIYGYTAYAPSKFALRGFAECLHMELLDKDVHVQLVHPPDTDSPGFHQENLDKPRETHLISQGMELMQPEQVAKRMVKEATSSSPKFSVYFALEGWMISTLTAGMSPETSWIDAVTQVSMMSVLRFVSFGYLNNFWRIITLHQMSSKEGK